MAKVLGQEIAKFNKVDQQFQSLMNKVGMIEKTLEKYCTDKQLSLFQNWNIKLEEVDKGLQDYLDKKRTACARFYFLDDEDLIFILSNADDIRKVEGYLEKIFANVKSVDMIDGAPTFQGIISKEGEVLPIKSVTWKGEDVEKWINKLIDMMQLAVKTQIYNGSSDYYKREERTEWVQAHLS